MATDLALSKLAPSLSRAVELLGLYRQATAWKEPVRAASTATLTQTAEQTVDGVAVKVGDRVLCKDQSTASQNGIWIVRHTAWLRAPDCDAERPGKLVSGTQVSVQEGTTNDGSTWKLETTGTIIVGTTSQSWVAGGAAVPDASTTVKGIVELATDAETATATATDKATTPANVAFAYLKLAGGTLTGALVGTVITAATALRAGAASWASTGAIRLANLGAINWRNAADSGDIAGLTVNASDQLQMGADLVPATDNTKELGTGALRWASIAAAGEVLGKDFAAVGLTGAVTATRYVGGTADVAPVTGTFLTGDYVISATARVWICTTGGSPGTWAEAGSGTYATLAGTSNLIDTAGDSLTGTADNTLGKLAKGTAFQVRRMNSAANAEEWATPNLALARPKTGATVYPGWPNAAAGIVASSTAIAAATDRFIPFEVRRPITVTDVSCSTTTTAAGKFAWVGIVALNTDMQPSAAVTQQSSVTLDATGTHTWNPTTLTLDAGLYAVCWNHDSTATFRYWYYAVPGMAFNDGAYTGTGVVSLEKARAAAAFSGTHTWDTPVTLAMSTGAFSIYTPWLMKWTPT